MSEHVCIECGGIFLYGPETRCEACQWNVDHPDDHIRMVQELEDDDLESLLGQKVDWYGQVAQFVTFGPKDRIGLRVVLNCERCHDNPIIVAVSTESDWCYVYDFVTGEYQADLRNESYICEACRKKS